MEDVIRINDQFYVLASCCLADDRTRVLKYGDTFGVFNRFGDIESLGLGEQGVYHEGTRYLSRFVMKLGSEPPQLLRSTILNDNAFLTIDAMNVDISDDGLLIVPRGTLHVFRSKFLREGVCYEHVRISNYSLQPVKTFLGCEFDADYRDIFEVRGAHREKRGRLLPARIEGAGMVLSYEGLDGVIRRTKIDFSPAPARLSEHRARFHFALQPKAESSLDITVSCETTAIQRKVFSFNTALQQSAEEVQHAWMGRTRIVTPDHRFDAWLARSAADLQMMIVGNPQGAYPYAGVPWFNTVFGRDGILTALECLWLAPWIARSVLKYLAETQATEIDVEREAEPGKILHETRRGEMAALKEVPFGLYYGSIDATPLFVILAGAYFDRTDDRAFLRGIWPNILAALNWIDEYGDPDHDGFVEYRPKSQKGLVQQGWKDSHDSIFHSDGTLAEHPIALCEVQGYAFAAKQAGARLAQAFGHSALAEKLKRESRRLQEKFEREFWDEEIGTYVLALDGAKRKCRVKTSNPGHCLFSGIASPEHALQVAESLLGEEMFCGWGIRTVGSEEVRYNPMSYHNGSVWPHDNAIAACGLARYGFHDQVNKIFSGLLEATEFIELRRLPELFCGFHQRSPSEGPTLYPVACSPQAWSTGSVYLLLEACLGLKLNPADGSICLASHSLPDFLQEITVRNLHLGDSEIDLSIWHEGPNLRAEILRQSGNVRLEIESALAK